MTSTVLYWAGVGLDIEALHASGLTGGAGGRGAAVVVGGRGAPVVVGGRGGVVDRPDAGVVMADWARCELGLDATLVVGSVDDGDSATLVDAVPVPLLAAGEVVTPPMMPIANSTPTAQTAQFTPDRRVGCDRRNTMARAQKDFGPSGGAGV
jgi:hypothetical protein